MGDLLSGTPKQKRRDKPDKPKKAASSDNLLKTGGSTSFAPTPGALAESNEETQTFMLDEDKKAKKVKLPTLFQKEKIVLGELCVVIKNGILNTNIKGIQPRLQCVIIIENQVGQTVDEIGNKEWNTEFIFPVSEHYEQLEIELNVSRIDLVTQEMRWVRLAGTSVEIQLLEMMKERDPRHVNVGLGKVKKGKPSAEVNLELMFRPNPDIYAPLEKLLFSDDDKLPRALFETFKSDYDGPDVAKPLLIAFWFNGKEKELLKLAIQHEVAYAEDPVQLLRGVTLSVKLLSEYLKILCEPFILQLLQPLIKPLAMQGASNLGKYEVDPMRINPPLPEKEMKNNQKKLTSVTEKFLKSITASHSKLPAELPELCRYLEAEVRKRFPGKESVALGALIFLRFICPSIVAPETAGLLPGDCKTELRRVLVLVTKVLQNIANEVTFGEKEGYMECMNPFVLKNSGKMKDFYAHILKAKMKDTIDRKQLLRGVPEENLEQIYAYCKKNLADLSASVPKEIATALQGALTSIEQAREAQQQMQQTLNEDSLKDDKKPERRLSMVPLLDKVRGSESGSSTPQAPRKKDSSPLSTSLPSPKHKKVSRSNSNHSSPHASCDELPTVLMMKGSVSLDDVQPVPEKKSNAESGEVEPTAEGD